MKKILFLSVLLSVGAYAQNSGLGNQQSEAFSPNDGMNAPGTFTTPNQAVPMNQDKNTAGPLKNSLGVEPSELNPALNPAPTSDQDAMRSQTLKSEQVFKTGPYNHDGDYAPKTDEEIQAEEERDAHKPEPKTIE